MTNYLVSNSGSFLQEILELDLNQKRQDVSSAVFEVAFEEEVAMPGVGKYIIYEVSCREPQGSGGNA